MHIIYNLDRCQARHVPRHRTPPPPWNPVDGATVAAVVRRAMNSIEMTDVDGDALSFISRDASTWVTCTSSADEVTVGPFPTRLVRRAFQHGDDTSDTLRGTVIGRSNHAANSRDRAWETFLRMSRTSSMRHALDGALDVVLASGTRNEQIADLAEELRQVTVTDSAALAEHLISLGYRRG